MSTMAIARFACMARCETLRLIHTRSLVARVSAHRDSASIAERIVSGMIRVHIVADADTGRVGARPPAARPPGDVKREGLDQPRGLRAGVGGAIQIRERAPVKNGPAI